MFPTTGFFQKKLSAGEASPPPKSDFLVDRMSDRFLFLKARFFGLQISMKFYERHGIHVFCFFLVVFVSGRNPSRKKTGADEICC